MTVQAVTVRPPVELRFSYPPGSNSYAWTLQLSTNLVTWRDVPATMIDGWINITTAMPAAFYRLKGPR